MDPVELTRTDGAGAFTTSTMSGEVSAEDFDVCSFQIVFTNWDIAGYVELQGTINGTDWIAVGYDEVGNDGFALKHTTVGNVFIQPLLKLRWKVVVMGATGTCRVWLGSRKKLRA